MKKQFNKKDVNFGCYYNSRIDRRNEFPDKMNIMEILDLSIPVQDKFWFVYKNCELKYEEMHILNLNLAKLNLKHYKETMDNPIPEILKLTELHEEFVVKIINGNAADLAAYRAAALAADLAAYLAAYRAADRAAYRAAYRTAYRAAETDIITMLKSFIENPAIIKI